MAEFASEANGVFNYFSGVDGSPPIAIVSGGEKVGKSHFARYYRSVFGGRYESTILVDCSSERLRLEGMEELNGVVHMSNIMPQQEHPIFLIIAENVSCNEHLLELCSYQHAHIIALTRNARLFLSSDHRPRRPSCVAKDDELPNVPVFRLPIGPMSTVRLANYIECKTGDSVDAEFVCEFQDWISVPIGRSHPLNYKYVREIFQPRHLSLIVPNTRRALDIQLGSPAEHHEHYQYLFNVVTRARHADQPEADKRPSTATSRRRNSTIPWSMQTGSQRIACIFQTIAKFLRVKNHPVQ